MNNPINQPKSHKQHCMVVHAYYPVGETRVEREALALVDRGYQVDVICLRAKGEPAQETIDGINVFRLPVGRHKGSGLIWKSMRGLCGKESSSSQDSGSSR